MDAQKVLCPSGNSQMRGPSQELLLEDDRLFDLYKSLGRVVDVLTDFRNVAHVSVPVGAIVAAHRVSGCQRAAMER